MKKHFFPVVLLTLFAFLLQYYSFQSIPQYKNMKAHNLTADSPKSLVMQLIGREEFFMGSIDFKMIDHLERIAEVRMINESTGDDSVVGREYIIKVKENESGKWQIIEYKERWKCRGILENWTLNTCS